MKTDQKIVLDENEFKTNSDEVMDRDTARSRTFLTTPLSHRGVPRFLVFLFSILGFVYVLNPTVGILEFIPDNLPFVGNLDEGGAYLLLWYGLIELFEGRKR